MTLSRSYIKRRTSRLRHVGKKGRAWNRVRRQLKCEFNARGNTIYELGLPGCMVDNGLGFAHALKRRHITTDEDMRRVILACNNCHDVLEIQGEPQMARIVDGIIARRA